MISLDVVGNGCMEGSGPACGPLGWLWGSISSHNCRDHAVRCWVAAKHSRWRTGRVQCLYRSRHGTEKWLQFGEDCGG